MTVGLLALQGAFLDHIPFAEQAGHKACEVRNARELESCDCLIIPGGESTVLQLYLEEENLAASVKSRVLGGLPVWGICAGAITLSRQGVLNLIPVDVSRNAWGRQLASRENPLSIPSMGISQFPAVYIRAPRIETCDAECEILAEHSDGSPVLVRNKNVLISTFHPELTDNHKIHRYFFDFMQE